MTIELDIIPGSDIPINWDDIVCFARTDTHAYNNPLAVLQLYDLTNKTKVEDRAPLKRPGYYYCVSGSRCTLSLTIEPAFGGDEDLEYVASYCKNMLPDELQAVNETLARSGYLITVASGGGRPAGEIETLVQLAIAIARLTSGYVVVKDSGVFNLSVGSYTPSSILASWPSRLS